jgi:hypothetical protein
VETHKVAVRMLNNHVNSLYVPPHKLKSGETPAALLNAIRLILCSKDIILRSKNSVMAAAKKVIKSERAPILKEQLQIMLTQKMAAFAAIVDAQDFIPDCWITFYAIGMASDPEANRCNPCINTSSATTAQEYSAARTEPGVAALGRAGRRAKQSGEAQKRALMDCGSSDTTANKKSRRTPTSNSSDDSSNRRTVVHEFRDTRHEGDHKGDLAFEEKMKLMKEEMALYESMNEDNGFDEAVKVLKTLMIALIKERRNNIDSLMMIPKDSWVTPASSSAYPSSSSSPISSSTILPICLEGLPRRFPWNMQSEDFSVVPDCDCCSYTHANYEETKHFFPEGHEWYEPSARAITMITNNGVTYPVCSDCIIRYDEEIADLLPNDRPRGGWKNCRAWFPQRIRKLLASQGIVHEYTLERGAGGDDDDDEGFDYDL